MLDVNCGLHSGFPPCCVYFFVAFWRRCETGNLKKLADRQTAEKGVGLESPGYVLCPACLLAKGVVKVKRCDCRRQRTIRAGRQTFRLE